TTDSLAKRSSGKTRRASVAQVRGGAAGARADAVAAPGNREAGRADADAAVGDPAAPAADRTPGARPQAKAGARPVILGEAAQKILHAELEGRERKWVFPNPRGRPYSFVQVGKMFRWAARAAGLKDFHFHDLRHHGATMALNKSFTAPIVMALGGWKTERMIRRYAAVTDQTLRAAAEAVAGMETSNQSERLC